MNLNLYCILVLSSTLFVVSCKPSKNNEDQKHSFECLETKLPFAVETFNKIDSVLQTNEFVNHLESESYVEAFYRIRHKEILINPWKLQDKDSHPMEFFSPANFVKINNCVFEEKYNVDSKHRNIYQEIINIPVKERKSAPSRNDMESLASGMFENN